MLDDSARRALARTRFAEVEWVEEIDSTNAALMKRARREPDGLVLVADHQKAGRGRLDRTWEAPPGTSLLCSLLLRPGEDGGPGGELPAGHLLTASLALSAADACRQVAGVESRLKWPNDLVIVGDDGIRKLGGILAEAVVVRDRIRAVVIGIGLNVNWPAPLPGELAETAASLNQLAGHDIDRVRLLTGLLIAFDARLRNLAAPGGDERITTEYREQCATIGQTVSVMLADELLTGLAADVDDEGHLVLEIEGGERRAISVGDVYHLRPIT